MHHIRRTLTVAIALLVAGMTVPQAHARTTDTDDPITQPGTGRVIVLVLDGVRWQDFFDIPNSRLRRDDERPHPFEGYWKIISREGVAFGDRTRGSSARMTLSGFFQQRKSLPSYQAILAGYAQPCPDNDCPRIKVETLPEALARRLDLAPAQVAVISSWHGLDRAAAHESGTIYVDAGDSESLGKRDGKPSTRSDERTTEIALDHLRHHSPHFLFVVLDAADHAAHQGDRTAYIESLRDFDRTILRFFQTLEEMGPEERHQTTLIVTTDHGRGQWGPLWRYHAAMPSAQEVFIAATGPRTKPLGHIMERSETIHHADLRPSIELLLGLSPSPCNHETCGHAIPELLGQSTPPAR